MKNHRFYFWIVNKMRINDVIIKMGAGGLIFLFIMPAAAFAAMSSSNYSIVSDSLNDGGVTSNSTNFATGDALGNGFGAATTGGSSSANYNVHGGFAPTLLSNISAPLIPPGSSGGGGGSGGGNVSAGASSIVYSGLTSPNALVQIFIGGALAGSGYAEPSGTFAISIFRAGAYTATIISTDGSGRSVTLVRDKNLSRTAPISGIFFPPTVALAPETVAIGDKLVVSGSAVPGTILSVVLKPPSGAAPVMHAVVPGSDGLWQTVFDTIGYGEGSFSVEATANYLGLSATGAVSGLFQKTKTTPPPAPTNCSQKGDLNCDGKVNLQDVSILLAFFKKKIFPKRYDLNADGKIDLIDFSIIIYEWKK
jgi:Dockerin type I domain